MDGQPQSPGWLPTIQIEIYQNDVYYRHGIWHLDLIFKFKTRWQLPWMFSHYSQDGHPPYHGWSLIIQTLPEGIVLQAWNLASRLNSQMDGQPPSKGWLLTIQNQTEESVQQACNLAYRLNHKIKNRWQLPWMVGYHPLDGHPPSQGQGWSPSIPGMVTYQP